MVADAPLDGFLQQECMQWEKAHAKMKDSPPSEGHDYLKHANNLLALLEGVAELHPIAKAVVVCFKTVVKLEQERRENDARATSVFLAQMDAMRVLLDVDHLTGRRRHRLGEDTLRSNATLGEILLAMQTEIKSCGNSIDTYYKEIRFVKFWKAHDWKNKMLEHTSRFNQFRIDLQQALSIQIAFGVEDIVTKMDMVLSRLFTPKYDWEKSLDVNIRGLNFSHHLWMNNNDTLQNLLRDTKDPSLSMISPAGSSTEDKSIQMGIEMQLYKVRKEVQQPLDALCEKNMEMFELKLNFHTQRMEQAIVNSAHLVIRSLSGPSDRLVNEDLRQLWKEMNWIFCVENKSFVVALFEFYLDLFSTRTHHKFHHTKDEITSEAAQEENRVTSTLVAKSLAASVAAPKFSFLSRLGALNHPDSWTLEFMALHGHHIIRAIDNDNSGFIRISEANAFADQIPKGWSLPQWCAYSAAGWAYEARIYRRRIGKIMTLLTDMQAKVLASNRSYLILFSIINFYATYHAFIREPTGQSIPTSPPELRELVKQKVLEQDTVYRGHLQTLKWTVDDESTLHLLYGELAPEKYILQFGTLMLEHFLAVTDLCRTCTIDAREWLRLSSAFRVTREVSIKRVSELQARSEDEHGDSENIATYYGGIWSFVRQSLDLDELADGVTLYTVQELADYLADLPMLDDFPIPTEPTPYLQYQTWEEHIKTLDEADVPSVIPRTWNAMDDNDLPHLFNRAYIADFPLNGWSCNRCAQMPAQEKRYRCLNINCPDFDLCLECHSLPQSEHSTIHHKYDHHVILCSLLLLPEQEQKIALEIELMLEQLRQEVNALQRSQHPNIPAIAEKGEKVQEQERQEALENKETLEYNAEEDLTGTKEAPDGQAPAVYDGRDDAWQVGNKAEKADLPQDTERGSVELEPVSLGGGPLGGSQETKMPSEETDLIQVKEEISGVKFAIVAGQAGSGSFPIADVSQENDPLEAAKPSQEESEEKITQNKDDKLLVFSGTADLGTSIESIAFPVRKKFGCGHCSITISLGSDFFKCVGHACQDYFVCSKCAFERLETDDESAHQWWHSLFLLKKDFLVSSPFDLPSTEVVLDDKAQDAVAMKIANHAGILNTDTINERMSTLEEKVSLLDTAIHSSSSALEKKLVEAIETRVERLETKMDDIMDALKHLLGGVERDRLSAMQINKELERLYWTNLENEES